MIISRSICQKKIEIKVISFKFDTNDALVDSLLQVGNFWPSFLPQRYYSLVWIEIWNLVLTWTKRNRVFVGSKPNYYIGISNFVEQFDDQFFTDISRVILKGENVFYVDTESLSYLEIENISSIYFKTKRGLNWPSFMSRLLVIFRGTYFWLFCCCKFTKMLIIFIKFLENCSFNSSKSEEKRGGEAWKYWGNVKPNNRRIFICLRHRVRCLGSFLKPSLLFDFQKRMLYKIINFRNLLFNQLNKCLFFYCLNRIMITICFSRQPNMALS